MPKENETSYYIAIPQVGQNSNSALSDNIRYYGKEKWVDRKIEKASIPYTKMKERRKIRGD